MVGAWGRGINVRGRGRGRGRGEREVWWVCLVVCLPVSIVSDDGMKNV